MKKMPEWIKKRSNISENNNNIAKIEVRKSHKVVLIGSKANQDKFLEECISKNQISQRTPGQDYFIATITDDIHVQVWIMPSFGITNSQSCEYILKDCDTIIFLEPVTDEAFITRAKRNIVKYADEKIFHNYYSNAVNNTSKEFLKSIYIKEKSAINSKIIRQQSDDNLAFFKKTKDKNEIELLELRNDKTFC